MASPKRLGKRQDVGSGCARGQTAQIGGLDRRAVGHRVCERHAEFDDVGASFNQRIEDRRCAVGRRVTGSHKRDEGRAAREGCGEAGHTERRFTMSNTMEPAAAPLAPL